MLSTGQWSTHGGLYKRVFLPIPLRVRSKGEACGCEATNQKKGLQGTSNHILRYVYQDTFDGRCKSHDSLTRSRTCLMIHSVSIVCGTVVWAPNVPIQPASYRALSAHGMWWGSKWHDTTKEVLLQGLFTSINLQCVWWGDIQ
jgi:hypothetical protein